MTLADDVNLEEFVMTKDEFSGADIKAICTEAGLLALRERRMKVIFILSTLIAVDFLSFFNKKYSWALAVQIIMYYQVLVNMKRFTDKIVHTITQSNTYKYKYTNIHSHKHIMISSSQSIS